MKIKVRPTVSDIDWARLAMAIDGEGSIYATTTTMGKGKYHTRILCINVANTDIRLPGWCKKTFGGSLNLKRGYENVKPHAIWTATCATAEWILRGCLPYFIIKREQAEIALSYREAGIRKDVEAQNQHETELKRLKHELPDEARVVVQ